MAATKKMETKVDTKVTGNTRAVTKSRGWSITINNPTDSDMNEFSTFAEKYAEHSTYQIEKGESGTTHLQGCMYFKNARTFKIIKEALPRAHIEAARDYKMLAAYCAKPDTRINPGRTTGSMPQQGRRTDLLEAAQSVIRGAPLKNIAVNNPDLYSKYYRGLTALKNEVTEHRIDKGKYVWLWGLAGVGKTKYVYDHHNRNDIYVKDGTMWWDGYTQQQVILIDDFDGKWPYRDLLRLLDRYPYQGQIKGGYVKINSEFIYITCEHPPEHFYHEINEVNQIIRRLDQVKRVEGPPDITLLE